MPIVLKSGNLNFLETFGLVEVCNGIALHFTEEIRRQLGCWIDYLNVILVDKVIRKYQLIKDINKLT